MSYVKNNLLPEEKVIYYTRPHYAIFYQFIVWLILAMFMFIVISSALIGTLFIIMGIVSFIGSLIGYYCSEYAITTKRAIMKVGFIRRKSLEILLERIEGVYVDQSVFGRILNFGTVMIIGVGGTKNKFFFIPAPLRFRTELQQHVSAHGDGKLAR